MSKYSTSLYAWCKENNKENLLEEWVYEKNEFSPEEVSFGSGKKVWWKCKEGHEWEIRVVSRVYGTDCPYCMGNKVLVGFNDLATTNPELLKGWDYKKNEIKPEEVSKGSEKKVWWLCEKGHSWIAAVNKRVDGRGCPYCNNKRVLKGYNDLASFYPDLVKEWHPIKNKGLTPTQVTCKSSKKVWWLCNNGHEWESSISDRTRGHGCPQCANIGTSFPEQYLYYVLKKKFNQVSNREKLFDYEYDINVKDINLLIEYDGIYFHRVLTNKKEKEIEKEKKAIEMGYDFIRIKEINKGKKIKHLKLDKHNILRYEYKNNTDDLNKIIIVLIEYINKKYDKSINTKIPKNAEQKAKELTVKEQYDKSIQVTHPYLAEEWHPNRNGSLRPSNYTSGSAVKVWWLCKKGHEWKATICDRTNGKGCPYCSGRRAIKGCNDLVTTHPELIKEWDYNKNILKPADIKSGSGEKVWWLCDKGHSWDASIVNRAKGIGCPICSNQRVLRGYNDLETTHPWMLKDWDYIRNKIKPYEVTYGSGKKAFWLCDKGHSWETKISNKSKGSACPYCTNQKVLIGYNDFATVHPELLKEWDYTKNKLNPSEISKCSSRKVWWTCSKGHSWEATVSNRVHGTGCPECRKQK